MLVVQATRFGAPDVLVAHEVDAPEPGAGEVVVAVAAVGVLYLDTQIRGGWGLAFGVNAPYVPGYGVAGTVAAVGEGVDADLLGRRVVAYPSGSYAERVVVGADELIPVPDGVDLVDAAALVNDGPTALALFSAAEIRSGDTVLLVGATGGAGLLLVQLAHAAGARVIATARGAAKLDLVRRTGADVAIDVTADDWVAQVIAATDGNGVAVGYDGVGGAPGTAAAAAIADGGRLLSYGAVAGAPKLDPADLTRRGITTYDIGLVQFPPEIRRSLTADALATVAAGTLSPVVGQTFPLRRAADAHAAIESRAVTGKTVLTIS